MHPKIFSARSHWWGGIAVVAALAGCGPQLQTQVVGRAMSMGVAAQAAGASPALSVAIDVPESSSPQVLRYVVSLPRATRLAYQIDCPSVERQGAIGLTFDEYRTRRLAELERERQQQANMIGSLVGAIVPSVRADAAAAGPGGAAAAHAEVNSGAAAAAVAGAALPPAELPPGDVGADVVRGSVQLGATAAGKCALTLTPEPVMQDARGAQAVLEIVRIVDLDAEARARAAAERAAQDGRARTLRVSVIASLQRAGADPLARQRARAAAEARLRVEAEARLRVQAEADARTRAQTEARLRVQAEADARTRAQTETRLRVEQAAAAERERREAAERERREAPERERREAAERERREAPERERREAIERQERVRVEAELRIRLAKENEARVARERAVAERRQQEWRARQASFALRWSVEGWLVRLGADPDFRRKQQEARLTARREGERLVFEARARREREALDGRRAAVALRFQLEARLQAGGADPDFRRKRDEAMFQEMDAAARRAQEARIVAAERVRVETQAAIDLRVLAKLRLRQLGAVDRPACPPPVVETPPPAPFPSAIWIGGRHDWNGLAWVWVGGHYEQAPQPGAVWVPPAQIALGGTVVIRAGRWVNVTATVSPLPPR